MREAGWRKGRSAVVCKTWGEGGRREWGCAEKRITVRQLRREAEDSFSETQRLIMGRKQELGTLVTSSKHKLHCVREVPVSARWYGWYIVRLRALLCLTMSSSQFPKYGSQRGTGSGEHLPRWFNGSPYKSALFYLKSCWWFQKQAKKKKIQQQLPVSFLWHL